jgi:hypothetical protein
MSDDYDSSGIFQHQLTQAILYAPTWHHTLTSNCDDFKEREGILWIKIRFLFMRALALVTVNSRSESLFQIATIRTKLQIPIAAIRPELTAPGATTRELTSDSRNVATFSKNNFAKLFPDDIGLSYLAIT